MEPEVLCDKNILLNVNSETKDEAIKRVGRMLVENGYVEEGYIKGMMKREQDITTYIGNGIAIPHGMNEYVKYIKHSGIVIAQYPRGVDFGEGNTAYLVIGIAGKNDDHMSILSKIAITCQYEENVKKLIKSKDKQEIIKIILEE
ncbi:PTS sugar transporter subunit IIA [Clostridium sp. JN-9]|uniref:PTS sugar transporter subunit IIA n=1 Tax=Clostridium sp. JN-9 TaxID=2507159 RepID=UPI000FFE0BE1|nr:PTS sugar transporter subunit IIA [Clostridium sp. JN-9]QAT41305.1 PTS mannitol transporter subunit IIA [Clostridium sp. JN-9]